MSEAIIVQIKQLLRLHCGRTPLAGVQCEQTYRSHAVHQFVPDKLHVKKRWLRLNEGVERTCTFPSRHDMEHIFVTKV